VQEAALESPVGLQGEGVRHGRDEVRCLGQRHVAALPAAGVPGIADEEEESVDVQLRRDPQLDVANLDDADLVGWRDRPPAWSGRRVGEDGPTGREGGTHARGETVLDRRITLAQAQHRHKSGGSTNAPGSWARSFSRL
jgi:hypothetical protein